MNDPNWPEKFILSLIETGLYEFPAHFIENKVWEALGRTQDRLKFSFSLSRIKYYLKKSEGNYFIKCNVVKDDFPDLEKEIEKYLKEAKK